MLVHDRGEQAQDGAAAIPDVPWHLPQRHDLQLSVQRPAGTEDTPRVPRLRSVFRRASVSIFFNCAMLIYVRIKLVKGCHLVDTDQLIAAIDIFEKNY